MIRDWKLASTAGVIGFQDQYSWRMGLWDRKTNSSAAPEGEHLSFFNWGPWCQLLPLHLSQLDLGNWLCWECSEDRWGQDEQVLLVLLVEKFWKSSLSFPSAWAPRWSHIPSQRVQEIQSRKNKLIMSNRAASLNKSPREAKLRDQCDASRTRLSLMIDGLIIYIF